jgi:membrane protease YdiL (CAAX protease family)
VIFAFAGFIGGQLVSTGLVALVASLKHQASQLSVLASSSSPPSWYIITSLLGLWVGFLGAAFLAISYGGARRQRLGLAARPIDLVGVAVGVGAQIAIGLLYLPFRSHLKHFDAPITKLTGSSHGPSYAVIILLTVVGAPLVEEIFFRGVLFRGLVGLSSNVVRRGTKVAAIAGAVVADGLLFALAHGELIQLPGLALFGMVLAVTFWRTGRLGMCIAAHISFNALALWSYTSSSGSIIPWH